jgi:energy-coupling factor transport system ATP-binding protein
MKEIPQILLENISFTYPNGTKALKNINLKIYKNEIIGVMGKNGAGKTTLIRTLNGLIHPTKGSIYLFGENINSKSIANLSKKVGIIFQNPMHQLFANSVEDEIRFSLKSLDLTKEEINLRIERILEEFNLEKFRSRSPLSLSGGETKKLAVASILCRNPEILIFDEPTLGQDGREIEFLTELIKIERENGKTIIIVTHNIEFAIEYIPRTIFMGDGQIVADGPTINLFNNKYLVEKVSLIQPQIYKFISALNEQGFDIPQSSMSKDLIVGFIKNYVTSKINDKMEGAY